MDSNTISPQRLKILNIIFSKETRNDFDYSNTIEFIAENNDGNIISKLYYSIGGGFIQSDDDTDSNEIQVRFKFNSAKELLQIANSRNYKIHELIQENEKQYNSLNDDELKSKILDLFYKSP